MRVLLISEGKHEESGALEALVRRTVPKIESCSWDRVSSSAIATQRGKGQGFFKRALSWIREARKRGFDALILVIDRDRYPERIRELDLAQDERRVTGDFPRALGSAIRTFDAWMLSDEMALSSVLGIAVHTQPSPEELTDPKTACAELLQDSNCGLRQRELYAKVAEVAELTRLEQRCPKGFGVFTARLRSL